LRQDDAAIIGLFSIAMPLMQLQEKNATLSKKEKIKQLV
jgi:hypothetical protein